MRPGHTVCLSELYLGETGLSAVIVNNFIYCACASFSHLCIKDTTQEIVFYGDIQGPALVTVKYLIFQDDHCLVIPNEYAGCCHPCVLCLFMMKKSRVGKNK